MAVTNAVNTTPPEPGITPDDLIRRARELRPRLVELQADTEERTCYSPEIHKAFDDAGFYRLYIPDGTAATSSTFPSSSASWSSWRADACPARGASGWAPRTPCRSARSSRSGPRRRCSATDGNSARPRSPRRT